MHLIGTYLNKGQLILLCRFRRLKTCLPDSLGEKRKKNQEIISFLKPHFTLASKHPEIPDHVRYLNAKLAKYPDISCRHLHIFYSFSGSFKWRNKHNLILSNFWEMLIMPAIRWRHLVKCLWPACKHDLEKLMASSTSVSVLNVSHAVYC